MEKPKTPEQEMQDMYENCFRSMEGRKVLGDILGRMGFFGLELDANNPEMIAKYNMAVEIARMARAFDPIYPLLGIPTKETK